MSSGGIEVVSIIEWALFGIGVILAFVGWIMLLIQAFKESLAWGLCSLFIPFVILVFAFMHWSKAKGAFGIYIAGVLLYLGAIIFFAEEAIEDANSSGEIQKIEDDFEQ